MDKAQMLLRGTDMSVTLIGRKVGLKSLPYFCELFARHTGRTPLEFRDQARSQRDRAKPSDDQSCSSTSAESRPLRKTG